jgi:excisionase family DNA binding protein
VSINLITLRVAAERLAVSERTVRRAISRGELPAVTVGRRSVRIHADDLEKVLRQVASADAD